MRSHFHFGERLVRQRFARAPLGAVLLAVAAVLLALPANGAEAGTGQSAADLVGRIEGSDVSVNGIAVAGISDSSESVSNGNIVVVHEGQARFKLQAGGEVAICGPAKFTALQTGNAITLALEFGRVHVAIPANVTLRVFTPSLVATPLDIHGGERDLIVGLDQNDSLCVVAASGAVQLEQQLTGKRMIIPEAGDFSLNGGELLPVVDSGHACQCAIAPDVLPAPAPHSPQPEIAMNAVPAITAPLPAGANDAAKAATSVPQPSPEPSVEYSVPAHADEIHPAQASTPKPSSEQPANSQPIYKVMLPPMTFSAASPNDSSVPSAESALLIRELRADPDWEFTGRVEAPEFAKDLSRALGESGPTAQSAGQTQTATAQPAPPAPTEPPKRHHGLWAAIKSIF